MSLTNPNKVVTESRLSEFYQSILPYLGGMPDVLANKFSKGDLYDTSEKMIGRWIDGKPLYQKTINNLIQTSIIPSQANERAWIDLIDLSSLNINTMVKINGVLKYNNKNFVNIPFIDEQTSNKYSFMVAYRQDTSSASNHLHALYYASEVNVSFDALCVTIQYTKTTDSAVAIGNDTDYSATEKIVGTWIDGKPIYQKTIVGTTGHTNADGITASSVIADSSFINTIDKLISTKTFFEIIIDTNKIRCTANPYYQTNNGYFIRTNGNNDGITATHNAVMFNDMTIYVTLQYTKTTD